MTSGDGTVSVGAQLKLNRRRGFRINLRQVTVCKSCIDNSVVREPYAISH